VRRHNLSTLLRHLHLAGPSSRSSLTTLMGLNRSTIADLVSEVELLGLAEQQVPNARGHPAAPVSAADVANVRARLDELTAKWAAVPVNASLTVEF